ncbi:DUF5753 domain-containing protein [Nocardia transvalensis]|uniref:DUF5753 domain-containing protein n=1 Tax=Nocardia transvalensis TaxID=37333 RepID=UPI00068652D7|nr:DUF5753 domain-containing protein [Nocardia transvalensis]
MDQWALAWTEDPTWTPEEVERRVQIATNRQQRLQDPNFEVIMMLSEAVLRNHVGSSAVMRDQLARFVEISALPNVTVHVVPFRAANPVGPLIGSFTLLEFPALPATKFQEPPVVYVEGHVGALYLEQEADVRRYRTAVDRISRVASDSAQSKRLISDVAREHEG